MAAILPVSRAWYAHCVHVSLSRLKCSTVRQSSVLWARPFSETTKRQQHAKPAITIESKGKESWDLMASVCLERPPRVAKLLTPLEKNMKEMLEQIEIQRSKKSDHELTKERESSMSPEALAAEKELEGAAKSSVRTAQAVKGKTVAKGKTTGSTAQDLEDSWNDHLSSFHPPSVLVERGFDDCRLMLLIQSEDIPQWHFPQDRWREGETLRQTADRVLQSVVKSEELNRITVIGNAPFGFYQYKYPKSVRQKDVEGAAVGAKVFFFKARMSPPPSHRPHSLYPSPYTPFPSLKLKQEQFSWLTKDKIREVVQHEKYRKAISQFLIDED